MMLYRDPEISTIKERIDSFLPGLPGELAETVSGVAGKYHIQLECMGVPGEYYDRMKVLQEENAGGWDPLRFIAMYFDMEKDMPVAGFLLTSHFKTGSRSTQPVTALTQAQKVANGIYLAGSDNVLRNNMDVIKLKEIDTPETMIAEMGVSDASRLLTFTCAISDPDLEELERSNFHGSLMS